MKIAINNESTVHMVWRSVIFCYVRGRRAFYCGFPDTKCGRGIAHVFFYLQLSMQTKNHLNLKDSSGFLSMSCVDKKDAAQKSKSRPQGNKQTASQCSISQSETKRFSIRLRNLTARYGSRKFLNWYIKTLCAFEQRPSAAAPAPEKGAG